jgi:LEA14-like dessication related protein
MSAAGFKLLAGRKNSSKMLDRSNRLYYFDTDRFYLEGVGTMIAKRYFPYAVALLIASFAGCEAVQQTLNLRRPSAKLMGLKFEDVKLDSASLLFDVEIDNHYPAALPLTNFDYEVSSGSDSFLSGSAASQTVVPAKSKKVVTLPATINYVRMLSALRGVRPGSKIPYNAELGLSVDAPGLGPIRLPLKKEGELVLPTISGTDIGDIWDIVKPK